jgi:transposase InsO family protein
MSGKGNCYDNAVAESFFKTLKSEPVNAVAKYKSRKEAKASIFEYIECYYNIKRIHSTLDYYTPKEYLERYYVGLKKCA